MTNQLALREEYDIEKLAGHFVKSGYFQDASDVSKAVVKIQAGREFGFGAFASMTNIYIIQGRPSIGANLMAAAVKNNPRYDYRVRQMDDDACKIEYFQRNGDKWESLGLSTFTLADARKAGTKNLDKFPRNMLFARAMSNGVRWYCPDVFGTAVYTPEEMGANVTEDGDVIPGEWVEPKPAQTKTPEPQPANGKRPYTPEVVKAKMEAYALLATNEKFEIADNTRQMIAVNLGLCFAGDPAADDKRHIVLKYLTGHASTKDLTDGQAIAVRKWLDARPDDGGAWQPNGDSVKEARMIYNAAMLDEGQQPLI